MEAGPRGEKIAQAAAAVAKALEVEPRLADPDGRVAALAMERRTADELKSLLERLGSIPRKPEARARDGVSPPTGPSP